MKVITNYHVLKGRKNETKIWLSLFQSDSVGGLCSCSSGAWLILRSGVALAVLGVLHIDGSL
jgi:hypothetical protein